jgi:hypothetical protein
MSLATWSLKTSFERRFLLWCGKKKKIHKAFYSVSNLFYILLLVLLPTEKHFLNFEPSNLLR